MKMAGCTRSALLTVGLCLTATLPPDIVVTPWALSRPSITVAANAQDASPSRRSTVGSRPYVWLSPAEIRDLPITGEPGCDVRCSAAWMLMRNAAASAPAFPNLSDQDETTGNVVLAKALVAVRLRDPRIADPLKRQVVSLLRSVVGTEADARALAVGRKLAAYVFSADIIDLATIEPQFDELVFRPWLRSLYRKDLRGRTLRTCHQDRPNNWGTHCGASRIAVAAYLDDEREIQSAARVFRGWLGDRRSYADFTFQPEALFWIPTCSALQPSCRPRPINPKGAVVNGHNVDGVIVDDQRRAGSFTWPPTYTGYSYGALEGAVVQAVVLHRWGFNSWAWSDEALKRAVEWLFNDEDGKPKWDTCGNTNRRHVLDLIDDGYGTDFLGRMDCPPAPSPPGRNVAWTSWTHQR